MEGQMANQLKTGDRIYLLADTGMYLSRIQRGDTAPIEAAKSSIDPYCWFTVQPST